MRILPLRVCLAIVLAGSLMACRKSDQTAPSAPGATESGSGLKTTGPTGKSVLLKAKWLLGNRYTYRMDLEQHVTTKVPQMPQPIVQDVTTAMTYAISVMNDSPDGGHELEMEFLANEMEVKMGGKDILSFDSKEASPNDAQNPVTGPFRKMIGSKLRFQTDAQGHVTKVEGLQDWMNNLSGPGGAPGAQMLAQQFNEGTIRQMADFGGRLPQKPIAVGESWPLKLDVPAGPVGKIAVDSKSTLKGFEDHEQHACAVFDSKGTMTGTPGTGTMQGPKMSIQNGVLSGRSWFDAELGALVEANSDQTIHMKGEMPTPPNAKQAPGSFSSDIKQKVTLKLVELGKTKA